MRTTPADPTQEDGPFRYTKDGSLLSPSGINTIEMTRLDRFVGFFGMLGSMGFIIWLGTQPLLFPALTYTVSVVTCLLLTFGFRFWRMHEVGRDVRLHGYPNTKVYARAAAHYRATGSLLL